MWLLATLSHNAIMANYDWNILILIILTANFTLLLVFNLKMVKRLKTIFYYQYSFVNLNIKYLLL